MIPNTTITFMNKFSLILFSALIFTSCYSYKTYDPEAALAQKNDATELKQLQDNNIRRANINRNESIEDSDSKVRTSRDNIIDSRTSKKDDIGTNNSSDNISTKSIIKEKGYYQLNVFDKTYKMEAVKWQGDTIVGHVKGKPQQELKFHEKDIQDLKVRQFSKGRSDAFTVAAYAAAGVGLFLILK